MQKRLRYKIMFLYLNSLFFLLLYILLYKMHYTRKRIFHKMLYTRQRIIYKMLYTRQRIIYKMLYTRKEILHYTRMRIT